MDTNTPEEYIVRYNAADALGNTADEAIRIVTVEDTIVPVISLTGSAAATVECGTSYVDEGATAADTCDGRPDRGN